MNELLEKYNKLSPDFQKQVDDFLDFLLLKYKGEKAFDIKVWKNKVKNVSAWTDEDIKSFEEAKQYFSQWKIEEW
jgi:hypothetical protein